jgi:hypothetical protein
MISMSLDFATKDIFVEDPQRLCIHERLLQASYFHSLSPQQKLDQLIEYLQGYVLRGGTIRVWAFGHFKLLCDTLKQYPDLFRRELASTVSELAMHLSHILRQNILSLLPSSYHRYPELVRLTSSCNFDFFSASAALNLFLFQTVNRTVWTAEAGFERFQCVMKKLGVVSGLLEYPAFKVSWDFTGRRFEVSDYFARIQDSASLLTTSVPWSLTRFDELRLLGLPSSYDLNLLFVHDQKNSGRMWLTIGGEWEERTSELVEMFFLLLKRVPRVLDRSSSSDQGF